MLIVKPGEAVAEARADGRDFEHWFIDGLGPVRFDYNVVRVDCGDPLPPPESTDAVLVTGSPAMVSHRSRWSEDAAGWLCEVHQLGMPLLGVCYGHQLIAHALGGRVGPNPNGRRMGRTRLESSEPDDPLLGPFEAGTEFHVSHVESVLEPPPQARVVATAAHDPHHAIYFGQRSWGVQFHPEFTGEVMSAFIEARHDALMAEGQDPAGLRGALDLTPAGNRAGSAVLHRFADYVESGQ